MKKILLIPFFLLFPTLAFAYTPPIGIPDPGDTWEGGLHPIDTPVPDTTTQCPNWPSAESNNCYYIDNNDANCTDSSNPFGYPDKPKCSFGYNNSFSAGTYIEFHGEVRQTMQTTFNCTATNPCWVVGKANDRPIFTGMNNVAHPGDGRIILTNSSYVFVDGLEFTNKHAGAIQVDNSGGGVSHHISIRNCYAHDYEFSSASSAFGASARDQGITHDVIMYHNKCDRLGDSQATTDTDIHCTTFLLRNGDQYDSEAYRLFWLENQSNYGGGSGIQVNGWPGGQPHLHHIYLGKNTGEYNRQRMIGIKQSSHVIVSQNNYTPGQEMASVGSISETFGWALSPDYVWFLFNTVRGASDGWRSSDSTGGTSADTRIYIIGNKIYNIKPNADMDPHNPANEWRYGQGVHLQNGRADVYVVDNTFYNAYGGIMAHQNDNPTHVYGNIFYDIYPGDAFTSYQGNATANGYSYRDQDYNLFFDPDGDQNWRWGSTNYTTLSSWQSTTGYDQHSQLSDPKFIDGPNHNLNLQSTSPAIDANNSPRDVYNLFQSLYGIDIKKDFNGVSRPQGNGWDMGAFEYDEHSICDSSHLNICTTNNDCTNAGGNWCSESCQSEACPICSDGIQNQGETGVDCGGPCSACSSGNSNLHADVNNSGTINTFDANLTFQKALGLDMSGTDWVNDSTTGDANCNGTTNTFDANLIFKYSLGLDVSGSGWCGN